MDENVTIEELEARQTEKREKSKQANDKKAADDEAKRLAEEAERMKNAADEDPYEALRRHQEEAYGNLSDDKDDENAEEKDSPDNGNNGENKDN